MANTASDLIQRPGCKWAFVLVVEGHNIAFTDDSDAAGIQAAWGLGHTIQTGLSVKGTTRREIDLLQFAIRPVSLTCELLDPVKWSSGASGRSLAALFADRDEDATVTYLTANLDRDDVTIQVQDTTEFDASGAIYIGHERITYSGKTATTFTGCTRGTFPAAPFKTEWAHTFTISADGVGPEVATRKREWKYRGMTLYVVAVDPDTRTWTAVTSDETTSKGLVEFVGRIDDWSRGGADGTYRLPCTSIEQRMTGTLLKNQYVGKVRKGFRLPSDVNLHAYVQIDATAEDEEITVVAGHYTLTTLIAAINAAFNATSLTWDWAFAVVNGRVQLSVTYPVGGTTAFDARLEFSNVGSSPDALREILGGWGTSIDFGTFNIVVAATKSKVSPKTPIATALFPSQGTIEIEDQQGTWQNQSSDDMSTAYGNAEGFVQVEKGVPLWLTDYTGGGTYDSFAYRAHANLDGTYFNLSIPVVNGQPVPWWAVRYLGEDETITVRQVWMVNSSTGNVSRLLMRMLTSTGTVDYNGASDKWPASMGLGIPASVIDDDSINAIGEWLGAAGAWSQILMEPESAAEHIESLMRSYGFHLVWRGGKITAIVPTTISALDADWALTPSNTGNDGAVDTESGAGDVVNELTLNYNRDPESGEFLRSETYINEASQSVIDDASPQEYDALGLYDTDGSRLQAWRTNVAAPACAFFGKPIRRYTRSCARPLWGMAQGDVATLTAPDAPSAKSTAYGVTSEKGWVISVDKNYETKELTVTIACPQGRSRPWAPSGMLDYDRGDLGYDSVNHRIYLLDHEFSLSVEPEDVANFYQDDWIVITEVDPATPGSPVQWTRKIDNDPETDGYIHMTAALSSPAFSSTRRYYVRLADYPTVVAANAADRDLTLASANHPVTFIGDDGDDLIQNDAPSCQWGSHLPSADTGSNPDGDNWFRRPDDQVDDDGSPLSVAFMRDLGIALNVMYVHTACQMPICDYNPVRGTSTDYRWFAGPYKVRVPPGAETIQMYVWGKLDTGSGPTGLVRITSSSTPPTGTGTILEFTGDLEKIVLEFTTNALTQDNDSLTIRKNADNWTWITAEYAAGTGPDFITCSVISGYFNEPGLPTVDGFMAVPV